MEEKIAWNQWNPGLDNQSRTLREVLETLPANDPKDISIWVRMFENPASPIALTGAVSLKRHDCIHVLLGRGLLPQDEAFVLGFTMGTAKEELSPTEVFLFKKIARYLYPTPYRLSDKNLVAYNLGIEAGKICSSYKIYQYPLEEWQHKHLETLRSDLGVDPEFLISVYARERALLPDTKASLRLPTAEKG
jgi:hypothetical protein